MDSGHDQNAGCSPASEMGWSGLAECATDNIAALRTHTSYVTSPEFQATVENLSSCVSEMMRRFAEMECLPAPGEPSFTLLGRDLQAPEIVEMWARMRAAVRPGDIAKIQRSLQVAASMREWSERARPQPLVMASGHLVSPGLSEASRRGPA